MKIDLHYGMDPSFGPGDHEAVGVGGTENFITYSAEYLARAGHEVRVYNKVQREVECVGRQDDSVRWTWYPLAHFEPEEPRDVLMSFRTREVFEQDVGINAGLTVIALADTESHGLGGAVASGAIDLVIFVSQWQADKIGGEENIPVERTLVSSNGVSMRRFDEMRDQVERIPGKCFHMATPERGLEPLLDIWPAIQERVPHAVLHLFSSFKGWKVTDADNASMCQAIYERIESMQAEGGQIVNHQHAPAPEIRRHLLESQLYLYPTRHFNETCCISALEASAAGVPIIATARAALVERVQNRRTGYLVQDKDHDRRFAEIAVRLLYNPSVWRELSRASVEMARTYDYARLVDQWAHRWEHEIAIRR